MGPAARNFCLEQDIFLQEYGRISRKNGAAQREKTRCPGALGVGRMHPRCSAEVRMAKALLHFFRDRAAMKQSGRRTAGAAVRLGCIFRRKNRRIAYRASKEAGEINENHFSWNRRGGFSAVACGYRPVYGQQRHPALHGDAARRRYRHVGRYRVSCADTSCGKAAEWAGIQFFT